MSWEKDFFTKYILFLFVFDYNFFINCNLENKHVQYFALKVLNIFNKLCKYFASFAGITDIAPNTDSGPIDNWVYLQNTLLLYKYKNQKLLAYSCPM